MCHNKLQPSKVENEWCNIPFWGPVFKSLNHENTRNNFQLICTTFVLIYEQSSENQTIVNNF